MNTDAMPPDQRLECGSTFRSLEVIVEAAQDFAASAFADEDTMHCFVLAVSEAVANAIEHGNARNPQKKIVVEFYTCSKQAGACVTDQGAGFDPASVEDPLEEQNLTRTHGRGLYIIHEVADEVAYEDEGRRVCMTFGRDHMLH